jgi:hypothetical protein
VIEVKNVDRIALIREAASQAKHYAQIQHAIPFVASAFLGERARAALKEEGVGSYRDGLVLVGGWVPYLLLKAYQSQNLSFQHIGSKDIDIVVNPALVGQKQYATIVELLEQRGYIPKEHSKHSFVKKVQTTIGEEHIQVDFLGPTYSGIRSMAQIL